MNNVSANIYYLLIKLQGIEDNVYNESYKFEDTLRNLAIFKRDYFQGNLSLILPECFINAFIFGTRESYTLYLVKPYTMPLALRIYGK